PAPPRAQRPGRRRRRGRRPRVVLITRPPRPSTAARGSTSCIARAPAIAAARSSHSRVLPSMSVIRKVDSGLPSPAPCAADPNGAGAAVSGASSIAQSGRGDAMPVDEAADPAERVLELLVGGRVAGPHVALPRRPESRAGNDCDALVLEQALSEVLGREPGRGGDLGERVERTARLEGPEAHHVEAVDDEPAPAVVLGE